LERAFVSAQQNQSYFSTPVMVTRSKETTPVSVLAQPIRGVQGQGMLAVVLDLTELRAQLRRVSTRGLETYVVDRKGNLMLHPDTDTNPVGTDMKTVGIVQDFLSWGGQALATATRNFELRRGDQRIPMLGTYCAIPTLQWAVIAQKSQADAYLSVHEMQRTSVIWGASWILACLVIAFFSARAVATPIIHLTESSRAIAKGDFSRRIHLHSRTEIGELADTFNHMTGELEQYVERLKAAAKENHDLFIASIRMIAAAVDEKDPYTHGHAERVTKYSTLIATEMALPEDDVYKIRISALLHDVGKIGIEDKILMARIIAVADTFDAMTTHRPYQSAMDPAVAIKFLSEQAGRRYDPACVAALQRVQESGRLKLQRVAAVL
jgi:HAMP domain-containing protein